MRRGEVFELRLPRGVGHAQQGRRFGVVVQSDALLPRSVVLVAPTSTSARAASFRPVIELEGQPTTVLVEQVGEDRPPGHAHQRLGQEVRMGPQPRSLARKRNDGFHAVAQCEVCGISWILTGRMEIGRAPA